MAFKQGEKYRCPDPEGALDRLCNWVPAPGDVRPRTAASGRLNFFDVPAVSSASPASLRTSAALKPGPTPATIATRSCFLSAIHLCSHLRYHLDVRRERIEAHVTADAPEGITWERRYNTAFPIRRAFLPVGARAPAVRRLANATRAVCQMVVPGVFPA
jgi:hypothetical protein